ncbi:MAG TPA: hypothetical protein VHB21_14305 [Minicystis sp.]|nr:hypothetical protein [Minicystis sp.]
MDENVVPLEPARAERFHAEDAPGPLDAVVDGRRVIVEGAREIVLRCGRASITLTRSGRIVLKGTHVVSQSSGENSIRGTHVRIN